MKIKRREFLTKSALGLGGALLGTQLIARGEVTAKPFDPLERVPLGKTKLKFSRVVLGTGKMLTDFNLLRKISVN